MVRTSYENLEKEPDLAEGHKIFPVPPTESRKILKIVLAEDDPMLQQLFSMELTEAGFLVHTADNGQDAFDAALAVKPDLIITDIMMPVMSGIDLIESVRKAPGVGAIPILAMSATQNDRLIEEILSMGVLGFLRKPMPDGVLIQTVLNFEQSLTRC